MTWILSIDLGTTYTSVATLTADPPVQLIEVDGTLRMPSTVLVTEDGDIVVGVRAERQAPLAPERVVRTPKRLLGSSGVILGDQHVASTQLVAAILARAWDEALRRANGTPPDEVRLTHPVRWATTRRRALCQAARMAGIDVPLKLVSEPVAAAVHLTGLTSAELSVGDRVAVLDLGGGTTDTAVLAVGERGEFEPIASGGDERLGGEDIDDLVVTHVGGILDRDEPGLWALIREPEDRRWRRTAWELRQEVRRAKEDLSEHSSTGLYLSSLDREIRLTRDDVDQIAWPFVERAVDVLVDTIREAGCTPAEVAAIYLAGGASRMPLVGRHVTERLGRSPDTRDDPKGIVVLGATQVSEPAPEPPLEEQDDYGTVALPPVPADEITVAAEAGPTEPAAGTPCPSCGVATRGTAFCTACGSDLRTAAPAASEAEPRRSGPGESSDVGDIIVAAAGSDGDEPTDRRRVYVAGVGVVAIILALVGGGLAWFGPSEDEKALLASIPAAFTDCEPTESSDTAALASASCGLDGLSGNATFTRYSTDAAMSSAFRTASHGLGDADCAFGPGNVHDYEVSGPFAREPGQVMCREFQFGGEGQTISWTQPGTRTIGRLVSAVETKTSYDWWKRVVGRASDDVAVGASDKELMAAAPVAKKLCTPAPPESNEFEPIAKIVCEVEGKLAVEGRKYANSSRLKRAFDAVVAENGPYESGGDCRRDARARHGYITGGGGEGDVACSTSGGRSRIVWTLESANALFQAERTDDKHNALYGWWSGKLERRTFPTDQDSRLLKAVPQAWRGTCRAAGGEAQGELAGVACFPVSVADEVVYRRFKTKAAAQRYFRSTVDPLAPESTEGDCSTGQLPARWDMTYDGVVEGKIACYRSGGVNHIVWFNEPSLVVGAASASDFTSYPELYEWWKFAQVWTEFR